MASMDCSSGSGFFSLSLGMCRNLASEDGLLSSEAFLESLLSLTAMALARNRLIHLFLIIQFFFEPYSKKISSMHLVAIWVSVEALALLCEPIIWNILGLWVGTRLM